HAQDLWHLHLEVLPHDILAAFGVPTLFIVIRVEYGDQIVELATSQRVMHEMGAWPSPQNNIGTPKVLWNLFPLKNPPIGDMSGDAGLAVADDALADLRPHAVATNQ